MGNTSKNAMIVLGFLALVALAIFAPLVTIWSVNTLFNTNIDYTLQTWLASSVLGAVVGGNFVKFNLK